MIWYLPIEPLEERYTEQWLEWFPEQIGQDCSIIMGETLTKRVESGVVLDVQGTNYFKFTQMQKVCVLFKNKQIHDGDIFFIADIWFPGCEAIRYMADLAGIKVKVYGFLHAGSYTTGDFAQVLEPWAKHFESAWVKMCDAVFVGTNYHRKKFMETRCSGNLVATGNIWNTQEVLKMVPETGRLRSIIYPHRWDKEKGPDTFIKLITALSKQRQDFRVVITTSRKNFRSNSDELLMMLGEAQDTLPIEISVRAGLSKAQYYSEMRCAKIFVSTTLEENFGYCLLEALTLGTIPVVPNAFSHPELLHNDERFMYGGLNEAVTKVSAFLDDATDYTADLLHYAQKYDQSVQRMKEEMCKQASM